jgi:hypothetical protein
MISGAEAERLLDADPQICGRYLADTNAPSYVEHSQCRDGRGSTPFESLARDLESR